MLANLDSVVLQAAEGHAPKGITLLGPWHPLVVAKRCMVQQALYETADDDSALGRRHRRLVLLLERVDGFRVLPLADADGPYGLDAAFAFPTSDPGWHAVLSERALDHVSGDSTSAFRGLGNRLFRVLGLGSPLYLGDTEVWKDSFVERFHRSHPSRQQISLRASSGIDPKAMIDACVRMLSEPNGLGGVLPGGIHILAEDGLGDRDSLDWRDPMVFVYEETRRAPSAAPITPDIVFLPQRHSPTSAWVQATEDSGTLLVPRGRDNGTVFHLPLAQVRLDGANLPHPSFIECDGPAEPPANLGAVAASPGAVGSRYRTALERLVDLATLGREDRPALTRELGLPSELESDWTVLPGAEVDAGALAKYIADGREKEERALWDYRLDIDRTTSSYFVVSKVPASVRMALVRSALKPTETEVTACLHDLTHAALAIGETMRSGKAAVGVLGVVGALRLLRAAWPTVGDASSRQFTLLLSVDCFEDVLTRSQMSGGQRADLLAINLARSGAGEGYLLLSACSVECKYASGVFPESSLAGAFSQAKATMDVFEEIVELALSAGGMHARLALAQMVRFGMRLLSARGEVTLLDEQRVLRCILGGAFGYARARERCLVVSTSCEKRGQARLLPRDDGWWADLSGESWPRDSGVYEGEIVPHLARLFPRVGAERPGQHAPQPIPSRPPEAPSVAQAPSPGAAQHENPTAAPQAGGLGRASARKTHHVFDGFVGNENAVNRLSRLLWYATKEGLTRIPAVALHGPKSTGKTEIARRLASGLSIPTLILSETSLGNVDRLAERIRDTAEEHGLPLPLMGTHGGNPVRKSPPMLVFIDEVHQLDNRVQDSLLTALEPKDGELRASKVVVDVRDVTFVVATTDWGKVREAFRSRFRDIGLSPYTVGQVAEMLALQAGRAREEDEMGLDESVETLDSEALLAIASAARAVPRVALGYLVEVGMGLKLEHTTEDADSIRRFLEENFECDRHGLRPFDYKYLMALSGRRTAGLDSLAAELGLDPSNLDRDIEPYLLQRGWVRRSATGRSLTASGRRLLLDVEAKGS